MSTTAGDSGAPDRVTREREALRTALEVLVRCIEAGTLVLPGSAYHDMARAALSTPQAGGEPEEPDPETVRRLVADSCKCDPYSPRHMRPVFVNPSCPWHGDRPAPQVAGPEPRGWLWFGNPGGPAVAVVLLGEAGWEGKRDALCSTEGHAGVPFYVATPPVAGSRETEAAYGVLADAVTLLHSMAWTDVNGPRLNCRWCHTSADTPDHAGICPIAIVGNRIADGRAALRESRAEAAIARLRAPAPGTGGEEVENG